MHSSHPRQPVDVVPIASEHAAGFHACLDTVAKERRYLAKIEALPLERVQEFVERSVADDAVQFVALHGSTVIGWADVFAHSPSAISHCGALGMGLLPDYRGQGLGRVLLNACIAKSAAKGLTRIELEVREDNDRAIRLYERAGFLVEGRKRNSMRLGGIYFNTLIMGLLMADRSSAS
jgi:ribosomal protein S18 acetylase RimI-like enzyme